MSFLGARSVSREARSVARAWASAKRRPARRSLLLLLLLAGLLPAQESRPSECAALLDKVGETIADCTKFGPAMLVEFAIRNDEPAYTLASRLWYESLDGAEPPADAAATLAAIRDDATAPGPKRTLAARMRRLLMARQPTDLKLLEEETAHGYDGQIRSFGVIGPFGFHAESLAGFAFAPEKQNVQLDVEYPGYDGPVKLVDYQVPLASEESDPFEVVTPKAGVSYAISHLEVKKARTLMLVLESESSVELFVDGQRALVLDKRREIAPNRRWVTASFQPGAHRLMVKTTDAGEGTFRLSVMNPDRSPVEVPSVAWGDVWADGFRSPHKLGPIATGTGPNGAFVAQDFRDVAGSARDRAEKIVAATLTSARGLPEEAYVALEPLLAAGDLSVGELWLAWRIVEATTHLPENDKLARGLDLARRAIAKDPSFAPMVAVLARNEAKNDRIEEGLGMLQKAIQAQPKSVDLLDAEIDLLRTAGFDSDRARSLAAALAAAPGSARIVDDQLALLEAKHSWEAWIAAARKRLDINAANLDLARSLGGRLLAAGRYDALNTLLTVARKLYPYDPTLGNLEAAMHHEQGDLEAEAHSLWLATVQRPKDAGPWIALAERLPGGPGDESRTKFGVQNYLEEALKRDPDLHDARRLLADVKPPEHDWFKEFAIDTKAFLGSAPGKEAYPDSRIVVLLDQIILWIHSDGTAEQETHQLHRLQDARGKDDLGTVHADGDVKVVQTILPDGTTLVPNPGGHGGYEMAGLAPGVVVERKFRRYLDHASGRPESFSGFYFQDTRLTAPFHYTRYVVVVPRSLGLVPVVKRFGGEYKTEVRGDDVVYTFLLERVPRIQKEVLMPRPEDLVPFVEFRKPDAWDKINRRYLDPYEPACRATPTIAEAAKKVVGGLGDPLEKARALYEYVMDTIVSAEGTGWPTQTLLEKSGDRFALYLALLRAAGVPHRLAMARTQEKLSPPIDWQMVNEDLFDYPLARIEVAGKDPVYVAAQGRYLPFGSLRYDLTDAPVFVTGDDGGRIEKIPARPLADAKNADISMDLKLDAAGTAVGTVRLTLYGWLGANLKEQIERTEKKRLDQLATGIVLGPIGRLAPKQNGAVRFKNATSRTDPLVIEVDVEMKQLVRKTDSGGTIEVPFRPLSLARAFVDRKERKLPFVFHQYLVEEDQATIDLDPVWKIDDLPAVFEKTGPLGTIAIRRTAEGTKLVIRREMALTPADIPATGFGDVASFAKEVDQAEAQKITLRRDPQ